MFNRKIFLAGLLAVPGLMLTAAADGAQRSLADDARDFGTRHSPRGASLSPDGSKLVYIVPKSGQATAVRVTDIATGRTNEPAWASGEPEHLRWCEFVGESRLVCGFSGLAELQGQIIGFSRLVSLNSDGSGVTPLSSPRSRSSGRLLQSDGSVLDWKGAAGPVVLMQRTKLESSKSAVSSFGRNGDGLGVEEVDVRTGKGRTVEPPKDDVVGYLSDGIMPRMMFEAERAGIELTGRIRQYYRKPGSRDWVDFGIADMRADAGYRPLAIDPGSDALYALKKTGGRDALYRVRLDGTLASELVAAHPKVDIDGIVRLGRGRAIVGYSYTDDREHIEYFDPSIRAMAAAFSRAVPDLPLVRISDVSADGKKVLFFASSDDDPGRYFLHDRTTRQMREIAIARPELTGRKFARVTAVSYPAKDGKSVPAYVTLPPGSSGRNLPAVVLPHGGPSSRDEWGFDWIAQFLAARGYAVIQPNFRGSTGYGTEWEAENGIKNWKLAISDISDAAKYLVDRQIADPNRLAIAGWSYGGYAALQSVAVEPARYKAAIAIAPVTDLALLKEDASGFTNSRLVNDFIGSGREIVVEGAPLRNVKAIQVPVLLVHGDLDANVGIAHSDRMAAALRKTGKLDGYLRYKKLDHQLEDSAVRREMLTRMAQLLERTIGK